MTSGIALDFRYPDIWGYIRDIVAGFITRIRAFALAMSSADSAISQEKESATAASTRAGLILDKYGNILLRVAYSYLHNMTDAEDILQDTLIQYIKTSPSFENDAHEKAWLITVASNLSKNKINYNKLRDTDELSE